MTKMYSLKIVVCKGLLLVSNSIIEVARGTVFQEIRPRSCFEANDFVKKALGGLP